MQEASDSGVILPSDTSCCMQPFTNQGCLSTPAPGPGHRQTNKHSEQHSTRTSGSSPSGRSPSRSRDRPRATSDRSGMPPQTGQGCLGQAAKPSLRAPGKEVEVGSRRHLFKLNAGRENFISPASSSLLLISSTTGNAFISLSKRTEPRFLRLHTSQETNLKTKIELWFEKKIVWLAWTKICDSEHKSQEVSEENSLFQREMYCLKIQCRWALFNACPPITRSILLTVEKPHYQI